MTHILRQSTQIKVRVGPFVDVTDAFTPETGITLGAADEAELLKADGAATVDISGATWAAVTGADGWYDLTLTTSHTDTVGTLLVVVQDDSVCLPVWMTFQVIEEAAYDAMFAASAAPATAAGVSAVETDTQDIQSRLPSALVSGRMDSSVGAMAANVVTASAIADNAIDAGALAADAITGDKIAPGAMAKGDQVTGFNDLSAAQVNAEVDAALDTAIPGTPTADSVNERIATMDGRILGTVAAGTHNAQSGDSFSRLGAPAGASVSADVAAVKGDTAAILTDTAAMDPKIVGTLASGTHNPQSGDAFARLGAPAGASVSADIAAIEAQTDDIGAAGAGLTALPWNAAWDAEVQSEVDDALAAAMADSYAADGAQPTIKQAILAIHQFLTEKSISGTTLTVKKPDGTTTAMTFTLNDAANPTSISRAS